MENLIRRCITGELSSENNKFLTPIISSEFFNGVKVLSIYLNRYDLTLLN
jgi:hypothetical protein